MERAGAGLAPASPSGRPGADRRRLRQGQQRRRRLGRGAAAARAGARRRRACSAPGEELPATPARTSSACPGAAAEPFGRGVLDDARRRSSTRSSAPASPASRAARRAPRSTRSTRAATRGRRRGRLRHPQRRRRVDRGDAGDAVRADATVTFHAAKPGLWIAPGKDHAGEVRVVDIGIAAGARSAPARADRRRACRRDPAPRARLDQVRRGAVLVCGGSPGLTGAPCLAGEAALRAGAGYVTALIPASLKSSSSTAARGDDGAAARRGRGAAPRRRRRRAERAASEPTRWSSAPGSGARERDAELVRARRRRAAPIPLLLDADGLGAHAGGLRDAGRPRARRPC